MAAEIIGGAATESGLTMATRLIAKARKFKTTLTMLESTITRLTPLVEEFEQVELKSRHSTSQETVSFRKELEDGQALVNRYSNVPWWKCCWLPFYQGKLQAMYGKLQLSHQLLQTRILMTSLAVEEANHGRQINCLFKAPIKPERTVGFDVPLNELKARVLQSGTSVSVLTGMPGSGKTTLATLLCWDEEVKGKFEENILFITVSKTPNLKRIVQILCKQYGRDFADLNDEQTVRELKELIKEIGKNPLMLVLDDVWPTTESESLIEDFKVQLVDYKILVTSRFKFEGFGSPCKLQRLSDEDAITLFSHITQRPTTDHDLVERVARGCCGLPMALNFIGRSLRGQPNLVWEKIERHLSDGKFILDDYDSLLNKLKKCLDDLLEDVPIVMECFKDLGLFPQDQKIPVAVLIDMWIELYDQVNDDMDAMEITIGLTKRNLAEIVYRRRVAMEVDMYYNNHFLKQHDLLRELAIHQSNQDPFEQRKRLMIDSSENDRTEGWAEQNQQGFPMRLMEQRHNQVAAWTVSISTDETPTSDWMNILPDKTKVLVLNIRSSKYTLPEFTKKMSKLKVLVATNYGFHHSELLEFETLGDLPYLKRIRLEKISVPRLCILRNLQKLSLHMCNTKQVFESSDIKISDALPNLVEMNIDYCKDLEKLPSDICNITTMKKLSITSCHNLTSLPQEIGTLGNLELLRLSSCTELVEIPESVARLRKLSCFDISECVGLTQLPSDIGNLLSLKKLYMWGCPKLNDLQQLPSSVNTFQQLQHVLCVTCDEEGAALWENYSSFDKLKIDKFQADVTLDWLHS